MVHVLYHAAMHRSRTTPCASARLVLARVGRFFRKPSVIVLAALAIGAGVWLTVRQVQINQDRARFMQAKSDIHALADRIVALVGRPTERQAVQSCGYTSVVYGRGYRFCDVDENIAYTLSQPDIEDYIRKVEDTVRFSGLVLDYNAEDHMSQIVWDKPIGDDVSITFDLSNSLHCGLQILRVDPSDKSQKNEYIGFIGLSKIGVSMEVFCGGGAKAEYFPVLD